MISQLQNLKRTFSKFYSKYYSVIFLNRNLIISGSMGLISSVIVSHFLLRFYVDSLLNSALTVIVGFVVYKTFFAILFHKDNKQKYENHVSGKYNFRLLKHIWIRVIFVSSVFDTVNNVTRFVLMTQLLNLNYSAIQSATISSLIASLISYLTINFVAKYIPLYGQK